MKRPPVFDEVDALLAEMRAEVEALEAATEPGGSES